MLFTVPILSKVSLLGSLINKCRQVIRIKPEKIETNIKPNISTSVPNQTPTSSKNVNVTLPASSLTSDIQSNRPATVAKFSLNSPANARKTLEEKVGLPPRPKRPLTPFFRYMLEQRAKLQAANPGLGRFELINLISKQWATVDASLKERLEEEFKRDREKYVGIRTKYDLEISDEQRSKIHEMKQNRNNEKERRMMRKRIKLLGRPVKPASAFLLYISKERAATSQTSKETFREWHKKITAKWKALSDEEKSVYFTESRSALEKYKKEMSAWRDKMIGLGNTDVIRRDNLMEPAKAKPKTQTFSEHKGV